MKTYPLIDETKREKKTDDWLTPPHLIEKLGPFDLDPCASVGQPWRTAAEQWTIQDGDSLYRAWPKEKLFFCNPPFGDTIGDFVRKCADHGHGILLCPAKTEIRWFRPIWEKADAILFTHERLMFYYAKTGQLCKNKWYGYVIAGFGQEAAGRLLTAGIQGTLVTSWKHQPNGWKINR